MNKLINLIQEKNYIELKKALTNTQPADIAELFEEISADKILIAFRLLPKELAADTFAYLENDKQELLIKAFSDKELEDVFQELFIDDLVDIVEEMPANVVKRILKHTDIETRNVINEILQYPNESAGSIMTTEFVRLQAHLTVEESFNKIRATGVDKETVYTCYVTAEDRRLLGIVSVKSLLLSRYEDKISDIMETNFISVNTQEDREAVAKKLTKYDLMAIPVVDSENRLVGIVTFDDAMDVIEEETEEDFALMSGVNPSDESYFKTPVLTHAKNRIVWLLFLMLSAIITGLVITHYENAFSSLPILVAFIPMLMGTGGNCGSQSATVIIRALALDEIEFKDILKVMFKELRISIIVGLILSIVNFLRIFVMYQNEPSCSAVLLAGAVSLTIFSIVIIAKLIGCALPMLAKKIGLDPAIMASPFISTIVDTCSVLIFFNIAVYILGV